MFIYDTERYVIIYPCNCFVCDWGKSYANALRSMLEKYVYKSWVKKQNTKWTQQPKKYAENKVVFIECTH